MADLDGVPTFGAELKDGFKLANAWVGHGIAWLDDVQQFYRDRSVIEKEYSTRLNALAKRYFDKKSKKSAILSVGETPALTPGSLESASLTTWTTQITTLEKRADEHDQFATSLVTKVAEPLRVLAVGLDEVRRRYAEYADRLEKERDLSYADLRKTKARYDSTCQEVETRRKKSESAFDKAKAQSAYQQQILDMNNAKNAYLIGLAVTNKLKQKYYYDDIPDIMDSLQDLSQSRTVELNRLWSLANELESDLLRHALGLADQLGQDITRNQPHLDSMMYIRHNLDPWNEPADKPFEPSPVWHDDDIMVVDDVAKVYLRNMLNKSKSQLAELRSDVDRKRRELDTARRAQRKARNDLDDGGAKKDDLELARQTVTLQEELHQLDWKRVAVETEKSTITAAVGDVTLGARNHNFKSQTFKIPTNCDLCGERIWGLSAKGFDCRDCGYVCHSKCELKVPADCPGDQSKEDRKRLKLERQEAANVLLKPSAVPDHIAELPALSRSNTTASHGSGYAASPAWPASAVSPGSEPSLSDLGSSARRVPTSKLSSSSVRVSRLLAPPPAAAVAPQLSELPGSTLWAEQKGKMLYSFEASGPNEITVSEGRIVTLLEPDDGTGWIKIRSAQQDGLVPTSYADFSSLPGSTGRPASSTTRPNSTYSNSGSSISTAATGALAAKKKGPVVAPKRGAKKLRYVEALFPYAAQTAAEHSIEPGDRLVLVRDDPGDGWVEVEKGGVSKSVPAAYVQPVPG